MISIRKNIHLLLLSIIILISISCNSDDPNNSGTVIDANIDIYLKDANGTDLLSPDNPESLDTDLFRVYYVIDGQEQLVSDPNLDFRDGYGIFPPEGNRDSYYMRLFLNIESPEDTTTTILKYDGSITGTFLSEINNGNGRIPNSTVVTKVWYNGMVAFDTGLQDGSERLLTIIRAFQT